MDQQTLLIYGFPLLLVILVLIILYWQEKRFNRLLQRDKDQPWDVMGQWFKEISAEINHTSDRINRQLYTSHEALNNRLDSTSQLLRLLNTDLGKVHEIGQQMRDFQHLLRTPKLRGIIGEQLLSDLIYQVIPRANVKLQHRFQNGQTVDALIQLEKGSISIDAKFPMENYIKAEKADNPGEKKVAYRDLARDVKKHIDSVSIKYIQPLENTLDFAVIYIPSEALYYWILLQDELVHYAQEKKILLCSPNSFYYFLKIILVGLEGQQLESMARRILQNLHNLQHESTVINNDFTTLLNHISHAKTSAEKLNIKMQSFTEKITELRNLGNDQGRSD